MKTKKALKLIKEILVLANELQQKQNVMKAVSAPIPDYKKGTTFSEAFEKAKNEDSVLKEAYEEIDKHSLVNSAIKNIEIEIENYTDKIETLMQERQILKDELK